MTKEEFIEQMSHEVRWYQHKLENADLSRAKLDPELVGESRYAKFNPFLSIDPKYFDIKLLSNLLGLYSVMCNNFNVNVYQIKLFIISNAQFKVLNQVLNYNPYAIELLRDKVHSPLDMAIEYARHCEFRDRYRNMPKR